MRENFPIQQSIRFRSFLRVYLGCLKMILINTPSHLIHFCKTISIKFSKMKSRKKNVAEEMNSIRWERKKKHTKQKQQRSNFGYIA